MQHTGSMVWELRKGETLAWGALAWAALLRGSWATTRLTLDMACSSPRTLGASLEPVGLGVGRVQMVVWTGSEESLDGWWGEGEAPICCMPPEGVLSGTLQSGTLCPIRRGPSNGSICCGPLVGSASQSLPLRLVDKTEQHGSRNAVQR